MDGLLFTLEKNWTQQFDIHIGCKSFARILIDQNRSIYYLGMALNARSKIDRITDTGIGGTMLRACITGDHLAGCNADANLDLDFIPCSLFKVKTLKKFDHLQRGVYGMFTMSIMMHRRAKNSHQ